MKLSIYKKGEHALSNFIGSDAVLTTSSGALAGKMVTAHLSNTTDWFFHHKKTHLTIQVKGSLPLFQQGKIHPYLQNSKKENVVILADAIPSLAVKPIAFQFLDDISKQKQITLLIDDSHGLGAIDKKSNNIYNRIANKNIHCKIVVASLGKALGLSGGVIASNKKFIQKIANSDFFISASSMNPAFLETYVQSQELYKRQHKKLQQNLSFFFSKLKPKNYLKYHKNYPVIYIENTDLYSFLLKESVVITSFNYPTSGGTLNRIVITANHWEKDLVKLATCLNKF